MAITTDEVKKIAHLARLDIRDSDIDGYTQNLSNILDLVEQLSQIDTTGIVPMAHSLGDAHGEQRLRDDTVSEHDQRDYFQQQAPAVENGLFLVPKVIE